jgi:hypothetical protein
MTHTAGKEADSVGTAAQGTADTVADTVAAMGATTGAAETDRTKVQRGWQR